mgnify:CR=1 FL=1
MEDGLWPAITDDNACEFMVLILVLMEDGLWLLDVTNVFAINQVVLILVLMEDGLWLLQIVTQPAELIKS